MTDIAAMIEMDRPRKIEEFYEAYKNVWTPLGSGWLGKFYTMKQTALVFGPDARGQYIYFWLTKDGIVGYVGYSFVEKFIRKQLTKPLIPVPEDVSLSVAGHLSYHSDFLMFQSELKTNLEPVCENRSGRAFYADEAVADLHVYRGLQADGTAF